MLTIHLSQQHHGGLVELLSLHSRHMERTPLISLHWRLPLHLLCLLQLEQLHPLPKPLAITVPIKLHSPLRPLRLEQLLPLRGHTETTQPTKPLPWLPLLQELLRPLDQRIQILTALHQTRTPQKRMLCRLPQTRSRCSLLLMGTRALTSLTRLQLSLNLPQNPITLLFKVPRLRSLRPINGLRNRTLSLPTRKQVHSTKLLEVVTRSMILILRGHQCIPRLPITLRLTSPSNLPLSMHRIPVPLTHIHHMLHPQLTRICTSRRLLN